MNPFNYDKLPELNDFCGRDAELDKIKNIVSNKNNLLIYGDRRYGKTSLIKKAFSQLPETVFSVYVDLYDIVDAHDFAQRLYDEVIKALPFSLEDKLTNLGSYFSRLKGVSLTPTKTLDGFSVKPNIRDMDFDELLASAFEGLSRLCERKGYSHAVIAFDEFQQIKNIKDVRIDAKLRKVSQENNQICFIFSGSKKNMLRSIINEPTKPFYGMVTPMMVEGIEIGVLKAFCEQKLNKTFEIGAFTYLYQLFRGQTRLILQVCYRLYSDDVEKINQTCVEDHFYALLQDYNEEFKDRFMRLPSRHKKAMKAIVYVHGIKVFGKENLKKVGMTKQALMQALSVLEENDDVIKIDEGQYNIVDVLFYLWLKTQH